MWRIKFAIFVFLLSLNMCQSATRINFPGCDRSGWKCIKIQASPIKYLIEYVCPNTDGVIFSLWNFNAPVEIKELRIINCTAVEVDLTCTGVGRQVESLHIKNVGVFNFTNILYKDLAQMPERVTLEDIKQIPHIPEKTFKQMKNPLASAHRCAVNTKPLEKLVFRNVNIGTIQQNAFHNLNDMEDFIWKDVKVDKMQPLALQVLMNKDRSFNVTSSSFKTLDYKAFYIKSPAVRFEANVFHQLPRNVIDATSFQFDFINNTVEKIHSFAFIILSQDITFQYNVINTLKTSALQGIGPGLLENALMSFGQLKFTYIFNNNTILHSDIGGLNPDWIAYKNVRSFTNVTSNRLPCTCKELGWITLRSGLGDDFSSMMTFNSKYLDEKNKNLCLNAPCDLPITVMAGMNIKFGLCGTQTPMINWCKKYNNNETTDFGFGASAKIVLNKWQNDFIAPEINEEEYNTDIDALENMLAMAQKKDDFLANSNMQMFNYVKGSPKQSYFKIERAGLVDPISLINAATNSGDQIEIENPYSTTTYPDIIFKDDDDTNKNGTIYKYKSGKNEKNSTNADSGFSTLKKEYEDSHKNFLRKSYEQWQVQRKKRMVYFNVYGNFVTLG